MLNIQLYQFDGTSLITVINSYMDNCLAWQSLPVSGKKKQSPKKQTHFPYWKRVKCLRIK